MDRWERRAKKLEAKRRRMQVSGRGIKTVILPTILKKSLEAKNAAEEPARKPKHQKR